MTRRELVEWRRPRRGSGRHSVRGNWVWGVSALIVVATAAMGVVWQKVRFEGIALQHKDLADENARLRSALESETFDFTRRATRATLVPRAEKLGLVDVGTDGILLVTFNGDEAAPSNPLLDGLVAPAMAADGGRDRR